MEVQTTRIRSIVSTSVIRRSVTLDATLSCLESEAFEFKNGLFVLCDILDNTKAASSKSELPLVQWTSKMLVQLFKTHKDMRSAVLERILRCLLGNSS